MTLVLEFAEDLVGHLLGHLLGYFAACSAAIHFLDPSLLELNNRLSRLNSPIDETMVN